MILIEKIMPLQCIVDFLFLNKFFHTDYNCQPIPNIYLIRPEAHHLDTVYVNQAHDILIHIKGHCNQNC